MNDVFHSLAFADDLFYAVPCMACEDYSLLPSGWVVLVGHLYLLFDLWLFSEETPVLVTVCPITIYIASVKTYNTFLAFTHPLFDMGII